MCNKQYYNKIQFSVCLPYMSALYVCLIYLSYLSALCVIISVTIIYNSALNLRVCACVCARVHARVCVCVRACVRACGMCVLTL